MNLTIKFLNTRVFNTRQALLFVHKSTTVVPTLQNFVTTFLYFCNTIRFPTALSKCFLLTWILHFNFNRTKATLPCILIIFSVLACHANVIRSSFTACAEVFLAIHAPNSKISHVICCLLWNYLTSVIFLFIVWFWWFKHYNTWTVTTDKIFVKFNSSLHLIIFNFCVFITTKHFFCFAKVYNFEAL